MGQTTVERLQSRLAQREAQIEYERFHHPWTWDWFAGRTHCLFNWAKRQAAWKTYFAMW